MRQHGASGCLKCRNFANGWEARLARRRATMPQPGPSTPLAPLDKPALRRVEAGAAEVVGAAASVAGVRVDLARHAAAAGVRQARRDELAWLAHWVPAVPPELPV